MRALIVVLLVLSFVLPTVGFVRLLWRAQRELRRAREKVEGRGGQAGWTFNDVDDALGGSVIDAPLAVRRDLIWDVALVGTGLAAGAVAGIMPLFIAVGAPS